MKLKKQQWVVIALITLAVIAGIFFSVSTGELAYKPGVSKAKIAQVMKNTSKFPYEPMPFGYADINGHRFGVDIATTDAQRARGLMFQTELGKDDGMFFVFEDAQIRSFWMENTLLHLDLAYIDQNNKIISIHTMKPLDTTPVFSPKEAKYVLEVGKGRLKKAKAKVGDTVSWGYF